MSIITLIVAQDALGVLGVLPGEVGFMWRIRRDTGQPLSHSSNDSFTRQPLRPTSCCHRTWHGGHGGAAAQLWAGDNAT